MQNWIDRTKTLKSIKKYCNPKGCTKITPEDVYKTALTTIECEPAAEVISIEAYKQVAWERDMAMKQIESYGVSFGSNAELAKVKHGKWQEIRNAYGELEGWLCKCGREVKIKERYCPSCGTFMNDKT